MRKKVILIVEDEVFLQDILRDKLEYMNFEVLVASNGKEGLQLALKCHPDLILLDIVMPLMNGLEMLEKICADDWGVNVPIIFMTNVSDLGAIIDILESGLHSNAFKSNSQLPISKTESNIKIYLEKRLGNNLYDYIIKTNCKLDNLMKKIVNAV